MKSKQIRNQINIDIPKRNKTFVTDLETIIKLTGISSKSAVVRLAVRQYAAALCVSRVVQTVDAVEKPMTAVSQGDSL
jgi:hypothetical protein